MFLGLVEIIDLPGIVITEFELMILGGECAWLLPYEEHFPTLAYVQNMSSFHHTVRFTNFNFEIFKNLSLLSTYCNIFTTFSNQ